VDAHPQGEPTATRRRTARSEEDQIITGLYLQGWSVPDVSARYGITDKRIYYVLKKYGIALRPRVGVGKVLSAAQEADIVASYQRGVDAVQLATQHGVGSTTVYAVLTRHGVARRSNSDIFRKLSPAQEHEICARYQQGLSAAHICPRYGVNEQTIYNILQRHGVTRRTTSEAGIVYPRNEHAFDVIDNEAAAYWLGFIAADGNVHNGRLRIGLSSTDADHLRKFTSWLAPSMPIYTGVNNRGRPVSTVDIGSKSLVEALSHYGIVPRKTYVMKQLPSIPHALMRHFLRGYVDADGYFSVRAKYGATFGVVALNREIVAEIQEWCIAEVGVSRTALIYGGTAWHYRQYGAGQVGKIATYLYHDATIYLDRKYRLAHQIMRGANNNMGE
jgi:Mor family transcriptional regulator